jgi:tRNA (guanine-N7-)-methyltransferase
MIQQAPDRKAPRPCIFDLTGVYWMLRLPSMTVVEQSTHQPRAFFGRRKGHKLRPGQARLMDTLLPRLAIDLRRPAPAEFGVLFPVPVTDVALEIGFGGGESMIAQAKERPHTGFIGVEPFVNGMAKALAAIESNSLRNIRLHFDDAASLIAWLPEMSLARIDLIHPDPWPKRRHWKRRFVQDEMVAQLGRILRRGGEFRFVTDIPDYAAWTLQRLIRSSDFDWTAQCADDWRKSWPGFSGTRYHTKAAREERASCFLMFRKI